MFRSATDLAFEQHVNFLTLSIRAIVVAVLCLTACATTPSARVDEFLDERTGASVTFMHEPLTFALERSTLAAHARDYVSLTAIEVDRSGQAQLYLLGYFWSTIDRRKGSQAPNPADKTLALFADGRAIRLEPDAALPADLTASRQLRAPQTAHFEAAAYRVTLELLRYISTSRVLTLQPAAETDDADSEAETYEIWTDSRSALRGFVARVSPSR